MDTIKNKYRWKHLSLWLGLFIYWLICTVGACFVEERYEGGWIILIMLIFISICMITERGQWKLWQRIGFVPLAWIVEAALYGIIGYPVGMFVYASGREHLVEGAITLAASLPMVILAMRRSFLFVITKAPKYPKTQKSNIQEFERLCENCFESLFTKAKEVNEKQFLTSFFAFYNMHGHWTLDYVSDYVFTEVLSIINDFKIIQDSEEVDSRTKTRIRMLIYCHIIEAELIYMIIYNMIRTIKKLEYSSIITRITEKNMIEELIFPYHKIQAIVKEGSEIGLNFESLYSEFYSNHLRNAFSHSGYFLWKEGDLEISKHLSPTTLEFFKKTPLTKMHYRYDEIEELFKKSLAYTRIFIETYKKYISEFMDDKGHPTNYGNIIFNRGRWIFESNLQESN